MIQQKKIEDGEHKASFDDFLKDQATGIIYGRDAKGLFKLDGETKVYSKEEDFGKDCGRTFLKQDDNNKCSRIVAECLISGDKRNLATCLEHYKNEDLFIIANDELEKMNADVAVKILRTFGVRETTGDHGVESESFNSWVKNVVGVMKPVSTRDIILGNQNLLNYLEGVIAFVNKHPAILNESVSEDVSGNEPNEMNPLDEKLGLKFFRVPRRSTKEGVLFEGTMLREHSNSVYSSFPSISSLPFTNAYVGPSAATSILMTQRGGDGNLNNIEASISRKHLRSELSSDLLWALLKRGIDDLSDVGMTLNKTDIERLKDGINKVETIELKTFELYRMLKSLVDLLAFFKKTGCTPSTLPREISLSQLKSKKDVMALIERNVNKIQGCVDQNNGKQGVACNDLMQQLGSMFEMAGGKK